MNYPTVQKTDECINIELYTQTMDCYSVIKMKNTWYNIDEPGKNYAK